MWGYPVLLFLFCGHQRSIGQKQKTAIGLQAVERMARLLAEHVADEELLNQQIRSDLVTLDGRPGSQDGTRDRTDPKKVCGRRRE